MSFVAALITPGATFATWFTVSLPAYAKLYLFKKSPVCLFRFWPIQWYFLFVWCLLLFSWVPHGEILNFLVQWQEILGIGSFLFWQDFQKIYLKFLSTKRCFPWKISLISSLWNIDTRNPFEFCGKNRVNPVSIFIWVAGSIFIVLGERIINTLDVLDSLVKNCPFQI